MTDQTDSDQPAAFDPAELRFVTRGVTDQEAAAVTAVLRAVLREESDSLQELPRRVPNAWADSQRATRAPLQRGDGRWRAFTR
jgi:hypothetical protein